MHIFPYWDFNDGLPCDVRVCSNAPRVELFKDSVSMGAYDIDHKHGKELTANYVIPYERASLKLLHMTRMEMLSQRIYSVHSGTLLE